MNLFHSDMILGLNISFYFCLCILVDFIEQMSIVSLLLFTILLTIYPSICLNSRKFTMTNFIPLARSIGNLKCLPFYLVIYGYDFQASS